MYDVVDEKEYAERVKGRVEEGFIVDDDGEYVEDGRYEKFAYQSPCNPQQKLPFIQYNLLGNKFLCNI